MLTVGLFWGIGIVPIPEAAAQLITERRSVKNRIFSDTLLVNKRYDSLQRRSTQFYDTLHRGKSKFGRFMASLLFTSSPHNASDDAPPMNSFELSRHYFNNFEGLTVDHIEIVQANVFTRSPGEEVDEFGRFIDKLHVQTRQGVIRRNLLFSVGDTISPYTMSVNEQLLRNLPYISTAYIVVNRSARNPRAVVVSIFVRDSWTISGDLRWNAGNYIDAFDRNFLGAGDELRLRYYFPRGDQTHGFEAQYRFNNLFGTFTNVLLAAGTGRTNNTLRIEASRPFLLPSDHIWGFRAGYEQTNRGMATYDTVYPIRRTNYSAWYGHAWTLDPYQGTAVYAMLSSTYLEFNQRPPIVTATKNPYYLTRWTTMLSFGFSRQNYFQGNMIYGYGRTEDIPFGFKFEAVGGYERSEALGERAYAGLNAQWGDLLGSSYFGLAARLGSYWGRERSWEQGVLDIEGRFFSPLFRLGSIYVRQFLTATATWGYDRLTGEGERIAYDDPISTIRGMHVPYWQRGITRATLSGETVFFTPIFLYHFRFAFYLWGDLGVMGSSKAVFANPLAATVGIGVRIKNERLIFNNIQIRLGVAIKIPLGYESNWFDASNEEEWHADVFRPTVPWTVPY